MYEDTILDIKNLTVGYYNENGFSVIINDMNLRVRKGIILGIAGESGSGKSTLAQAIYRSLKYPGEITSGQVYLDDQDILRINGEDLRRIRATRFSFIPQAAMNALNPVKRIRYQFYDLLIAHGLQPEKNEDRIQAAIKMVRLRENVLESFPHELSGGMRQRVVIAMSLLLRPDLVILDEPTTGLDVLVQHEILKDLKAIQRQSGLTMIFITHDLSILYEIADEIAMIYAGEIVEFGPRDEMLNDPQHPYNFLLLRSMPRIGAKRGTGYRLIGNPGNFREDFNGCQFYTRCPFSVPQCVSKHPELTSDDGRHFRRCLRYPEWKVGVS
ncbi:ABC transporter ATP-binding protein [Thermoplasma acidophilum]|nr:ABC transporter ATP-binding protein [Thermoplasma acidophilum]